MRALAGILLLSFLNLVASDLALEYNHFVSLDPAQRMKLYWTVDRREQSISFAVQAASTGWVGFGFSTGTGRMKGADVIIGWVDDNGKATLTNRHAEGQWLPEMDDDQSTYTLLEGTEINGITTLKFKRNINTCSKDDRLIEEGTTKVIFAYHDQDPKSVNDLSKHSYKGARSLLLLNYGKKGQSDPRWSIMDMVMKNVSIPKAKTSYLCKTFQVPPMPGKRHIVRFEPVVQPGNEGFVHHFVVNECHARFNVTIHNRTLDCLDYANMPQEVMNCKGFGDIVAAWGVGGGPFLYPDHVGFPIGTPDSGTIFIMEVHYDNPEQLAGRSDSSGVRFYYTDQLRMYDSGTWTVGVSVTNWMVIPPKQQGWMVEGHCRHECTQHHLENSTLPGKGINIFAVFLHTHLAGRGTWTKHFRNGVELPEIARDNYYDFNFQEIQALPKETHIKPGDDVIHYCRYNTVDRQATTYGGLSTKDEMCLTFMLYYPRLHKKLTDCGSSEIATTYQFLAKHMPYYAVYAHRYYNPMIKANATWTAEMLKEFDASRQDAKKVYIDQCPAIPINYPVLGLATGNHLSPKVVITKPLNPPVSVCMAGAAHTLHSGMIVMFNALLIAYIVTYR